MQHYRSIILSASLLALAGCDLGTTYEGAGPMFYETYTRDPALRAQSEVAKLADTPTSMMPTEGSAEFTGGFVGQVGGCGFDPGCDSGNNVYGRSSLRADFASGEVQASISRLVIEYSETDEFGYHSVKSVFSSVGTTTPGVISGNGFSGLEMSTGNYYGNNDFIIHGDLNGTFKGNDASSVSANFNGSIASVTGGYPLDGYETLTGRISAQTGQ